MITIAQEDFQKACAAIASIAKKGAISPAAEMAFLSSEAGMLTIKGTDLENWLSLTVEGKGDIEPIQVDAFKLAELVAKLTGDDVKADVKDGYLHLSSGKSKRKLSGHVTNYPEVPAPTGPDECTLQVDDLRAAVSFCHPSIGDGDKSQFNGVRLQAGNAVAYNGSGFAGATVTGLTCDLTLAPGTIKLLKWLPEGETVRLVTGERLLSLEWNGGRLLSSKMEGDWPFLRNGLDAILAKHEHALVVSPFDLSTAINAVKAVAADDKLSKSKVVTLLLSATNGVMVSVASSAGTAEEPVDAEWDGPDLRVNMSAARLASILSGFAQDLPVNIGISPLPDVGAGQPKGSVIRQDAKPGFVGMLAQIR